MSIMDYSPAVRIYWDGRRGVASGTSVRRDLCDKPVLGFRFVEVDYSPGICSQVRREPWHAVNDMTPDEIMACVRYLSEIG